MDQPRYILESGLNPPNGSSLEICETLKRGCTEMVKSMKLV